MTTRIDMLKEGQVLSPSPWIPITQERINNFADATGDHQWIHIDAARCAKESPFKTTIAHGLLTTSLMPSVFYEMVSIDPATQTVINYGMDSLRFIESVRVDDEIRFEVTVSAISEKPTGRLYKFLNEVRIKDRDKPAMVGTFLMLLLG